MAFSVQQFISNMLFDGARPNLFQITFDPIIGDAVSFALRAKATQIPGSILGVAPTSYFGRQVKFAGNRTFENWTVTILNDEQDYAVGPRSYLEQWAARLNTHESNKRVSAYNSPYNYMKDATINHFGKDGRVIASYRMIQCFPIDIAPIGLDWAANDTIEEFTVTFAMQYWESQATDVVNAENPTILG